MSESLELVRVDLPVLGSQTKKGRDIQDECSALGNLGCSKKSTEKILVNRSLEKQSESDHVRPY